MVWKERDYEQYNSPIYSCILLLPQFSSFYNQLIDVDNTILLNGHSFTEGVTILDKFEYNHVFEELYSYCVCFHHTFDNLCPVMNQLPAL